MTETERGGPDWEPWRVNLRATVEPTIWRPHAVRENPDLYVWCPATESTVAGWQRKLGGDR